VLALAGWPAGASALSFSPTPGSPFATGSTPRGVAEGKFDGDNELDLAIANSGGSSVTVLLGDGAGGFSAAPGSPFATGVQPASVAVADFNGDGNPDLAIGAGQFSGVMVLLGDGAGGFSAAPGSPFPTGSIPFSVAVGDFNGDHKLDLVTANVGDNNVTVLLGDGAGGFSAAPGSPFPTGSTPYSVAPGDFQR